MSRTRTKICGITRVADAHAAADAGADAIGLVFYRDSSRFVSIENAQSIVAALPPLVTAVGLFVDPDAQQVEETLSVVPLGLLHFHGSEDAGFARQFGKPYLRAIRMQADIDVLATVNQHPQACGFLLDTFQAGKAGGTGHMFDWDRVPRDMPNLVLAGGLDVHNVASAIQQCRPYAVDVSSAVESAPGIKDAEKIQQFIAACKKADGSGAETQ
ncbi:MAG: phosphoribosylanthranilate isomerase [Pseudomonadales bacterium]